jgi:FkbM family methyltransferase
MGYRLHYLDLLTVAPQWDDTFVRERQAFRTSEPSPRVLDCGANVGIVTLYFKRTYPSARITAFEADPRIAEALSRNVEENHLSGVDVVQAAVWDQVGQITFIAEGSDSGSIASEYHGEATNSITVPTVRLRDILAAEDQVDLLKLDIEGAEHRVLADCEGELHRVLAIAVEIHNFGTRRRQAPATLELLTRAGFIYAHGGVDLMTPTGSDAPAAAPFSNPTTRWVERIYAWRE